MSLYDDKPWLNLYDPGQPTSIGLEFTDALAMFRASVSRPYRRIARLSCLKRHVRRGRVPASTVTM
jgi:long-chain acyl-CoA synthetase